MNNTTTDEATNPPAILLGVTLTINIAGVFGNVLFVIAHVKDALKILKSSSSTFIFSLGLIDLQISFILFLDNVSLIAFMTMWHKATPMNYIAEVQSGVFQTASFTLYVSLTIERFCSVEFPMWHRVNFTNRKCRYWVIGSCLALIFMEVGKVILNRIIKMAFQLYFAHVVCMCVMFFLTQFVYIASYLSIRKQDIELQRQDMSEATFRANKVRLKNEFNFLLTIAIVCLILAVTILPFLTITFMFVVKATTMSDKDYNQAFPSYYRWGYM